MASDAWRSDEDPLRFTEHTDTDGEACFRHACASGWEGIIAKRADAPYRPGRTKDWLKFKCESGQEFVIGVGFSEWTTGGELRHPRFQGLRDDKDPADVVREMPQDNAR
jgi:ATP-dependent DNA ligase